MDEMDRASEWYAQVFETLSSDVKISYAASLVFTELYMNAYEHGNLAIDANTKHILLENDTYFETLQEKSQHCSKKINIKIYRINNHIITQITDEGDGFDIQTLSEIFRNGAKFNGRGVFVSRKNSLGIYYNSKGNSVLYLNKV